MRRFGSEPVDGQTPRELQQPYRRQELSKAELREMLAEAVRNTAKLTIQRIEPSRRKP
jgi:hypothetical protein